MGGFANFSGVNAYRMTAGIGVVGNSGTEGGNNTNVVDIGTRKNITNARAISLVGNQEPKVDIRQVDTFEKGSGVALVGELVDEKDIIGVKYNEFIGLEISRFVSVLESVSIKEDRLFEFMDMFLDKKYIYSNSFVGDDREVKLKAFYYLKQILPYLILFYMCKVLVSLFQKIASKKDEIIYLELLSHYLEKIIIDLFMSFISKNHGVGFDLSIFIIKSEEEFGIYVRENFFKLYKNPKILNETWTYKELFTRFFNKLSKPDKDNLLLHLARERMA